MEVTNISDLTGAEIYGFMDRIKADYLKGNKQYEIAKQEIAVFVREINLRGATIAKKHGKTYRPITVGYVLR